MMRRMMFAPALALATTPLSGSVSAPWPVAAAAAGATAAAQARCAAEGTVVQGGKVMDARIYRAMTGFAAQGGTTGGLGRTRFVVTRADDPQGKGAPGTLRDAAARAAAAGGGWIAFAPALAGKTITLTAPLRLGSNITVDGGCAAPMVTGQFRGSLVYLAGSRNVVMTRLSLQHAGPGTQGDCITVSHGADRIWLAYMRLRQCHDGLIDVTRDGNPGAMRVTISNNQFLDHDKAMLIVGGPVGPSCALSSNPVQVTVYRNMFLRTGQRHPRVSGDAFVDLAQNVVAFSPRQRAGGQTGGAYGTLATNGARVLIDGTAYVPPAGKKHYRIASNRAGNEDKASDARCSQGELEWEGSRPAGQAITAATGPAKLARMRPYRLPDLGTRAAPAMIRDLETRTGPSGI
ncbi:hypothetical protein NT2_01_01930 [Caenibius tardaugens NBRC 16725]|uniref:Pectate lyase domain-containing protein n=2 Tax=Caenibius TaxID=2827482 RepID=U2YH84_9SPHN|nr:hypothetical protein NT2_01_01930 [Caenibius tardaugens NBRC 16725]